MKPLLSKGLNSADAAIQWFRKRVPMTDRQVSQADAAAAKKAFYVSNVAQVRMVSDVMDAIQVSLDNGEAFSDFKEAVSDKLARAWGGANPHRVENIFRTNIQRAYMAGRMHEMTDPAVLRFRPYWRYDSIMDDAICPICEPWDGTTLPADDPAWAGATPPMHFQCRCVLVSLSEDEVDDEDVTDNTRDLPEPLDGFGEPADLDDVDTEDLTGVDSQLVHAMLGKGEG